MLKFKDNQNERKDLYKEYNYLRSFFYKRMMDKDMADDLIQESFLKLFSVRIFSKVKSVSNYLMKIANNLLIDFIRNKVKNRVEFSLDNEVKFTKDNVGNLEEKLNFEQIISFLDEEERIILKMKFVDNLTFREISELMNKNINTVLSKFNKALKKLRKSLFEKIKKEVG